MNDKNQGSDRGGNIPEAAGKRQNWGFMGPQSLCVLFDAQFHIINLDSSTSSSVSSTKYTISNCLLCE